MRPTCATSDVCPREREEHVRGGDLGILVGIRGRSFCRSESCAIYNCCVNLKWIRKLCTKNRSVEKPVSGQTSQDNAIYLYIYIQYENILQQEVSFYISDPIIIPNPYKRLAEPQWFMQNRPFIRHPTDAIFSLYLSLSIPRDYSQWDTCFPIDELVDDGERRGIIVHPYLMIIIVAGNLN